MSILLISPHSDDIALSMSDFIDVNLQGYQLHLVTVFSSTNYAYGKFTDEDVSNIRINEDREFYLMKRFSSYTSLDFEDACLRFPNDFEMLDFLSIRHENLYVLGEIKECIESLIKDLKVEVVFLPCGFGHRDHYLVREIFKGLPQNVCLYSDFPYWTTISEQSRYDIVTKVFGDIVPHKVPFRDEKIKFLSLYKSQVDEKIFEKVKTAGLEEIWAKKPFWRKQ